MIVYSFIDGDKVKDFSQHTINRKTRLLDSKMIKVLIYNIRNYVCFRDIKSTSAKVLNAKMLSRF